MKPWRLVIFYILMAALPTSNFASVLVVSHCHTSNEVSHSMHTDMQGSDSMHMHSKNLMANQDHSGQSECECGCDNDVNCSVSSCSTAALLNATGIDSGHLTQSFYLDIDTLAIPPDPHPLFRPPISLS